jgi:hypothetical protein
MFRHLLHSKLTNYLLVVKEFFVPLKTSLHTLSIALYLQTFVYALLSRADILLICFKKKITC